jgi:hypothetical protein
MISYSRLGVVENGLWRNWPAVFLSDADVSKLNVPEHCSSFVKSVAVNSVKEVPFAHLKLLDVMYPLAWYYEYSKGR